MREQQEAKQLEKTRQVKLLEEQRIKRAQELTTAATASIPKTTATMVRPLTTQAVAPVKPPFGPTSGTTTVGQQPLAKKPSGSNVFGIFAKKPAAVPGAPVSNPPAIVASTTLGSTPSAQPVPQKERPVDVIPSAKPMFDTVGGTTAPVVTVARAAVQPTTPVVLTATTNFPRPEPIKAESPAVAMVKPAAPGVMSPVAALPVRTAALDMKEQLRQPLESSVIVPADEYEYEIDDRYNTSPCCFY